MDEWFIAYTTEPWGDLRADLRMAVQTAALVNIHIPKDKARMATKPTDYLLFDWREQAPAPAPARTLTPDETAALFETILMGAASTNPPAA